MNTDAAHAATPTWNNPPPRSAASGVGGGAPGGSARPAARRPGRGVPTWLLLLLILSAAAVPMLTGLVETPAHDPSETLLLETARQSWQRQHTLAGDGWSVGRFIPVRDGEPVLTEAPGAVWMNWLAWLPADPETASAESLLLRARLLSVGMALLAVAAAFWAGHALGGKPVAALTGLVVLANPLLTLAGRTANGEALVMGWTVLAGAAALWAMRPMKPAASLVRQGVGWGICGGAMGMTALVGGIDAALPAALPLGLLVLLCRRRPGNALGLGAAAAIGLLMVTPWVLYVHQHSHGMWERWVGALSPSQTWTGSTMGQRLAERGELIARVWGLWGLLVVLALVWPFVPGASVGGTVGVAESAGGRAMPGPRRRLFVGWGWLVGVTAMVMLAPPGMTAGVLLVTLPVGALVAAQMLWSVTQATAQGRQVGLWRSFAAVTAVAVLLASGLLPWAMASQESLVQAGWLERVFADAMSPGYWMVSAGLLGVLAVGALVLSLGDRPTRAAVCWSAWSLVATTAVMTAVAQGPGIKMIELDTARSQVTAEKPAGEPATLPLAPAPIPAQAPPAVLPLDS